MRLSSLDIRKQEFTRRMRGYDPEEVQAFLQMLSSQWQEVQDERTRLEEKLRDMEVKLRHYERVEEALQEALHTARESSRIALHNAEQKAERIRMEAETKAEEIVRDAEQNRNRLRQETQAISARRREVVARLRGFLMSEMEMLAHFEGDDAIGFIKLMPAEKRQIGSGSEGSSDKLEAPIPYESEWHDEKESEETPSEPPSDEAPSPDAGAPEETPAEASSSDEMEWDEETGPDDEAEELEEGTDADRAAAAAFSEPASNPDIPDPEPLPEPTPEPVPESEPLPTPEAEPEPEPLFEESPTVAEEAATEEMTEPERVEETDFPRPRLVPLDTELMPVDFERRAADALNQAWADEAATASPDEPVLEPPRLSDEPEEVSETEEEEAEESESRAPQAWVLRPIIGGSSRSAAPAPTETETEEQSPSSASQEEIDRIRRLLSDLD